MKKIMEIMGGAVLGAFIGLGIVWYAFQAELSFGQVLSGALVLFVSFFLHIMIHEGGHLLFGLLTGYKFVSFRVFSFMWQKTPSGIQFKRQSVPGTAGQCLLAPPPYVAGHYPFKLYLLGGGLANMLTSLLALVLGLVFPAMGFYLFIFALMGILLGLTNVIPTGFNDGMSLKMAWHNEQVQEFLHRQLYLNEQMAQGILLNELPDHLFELPAQVDGANYYEIWLFFLAYSRELEAGNLEKGKEILDLVWLERDKLLGLYQVSLDLEMIYCLSRLDPENALGAQLFNKRQNQQFLRMKMMANERVKAAFSLYVEREPAKAFAHCQQGLAYRATTPILTDAMMEEKLLWQLLEAAKEQLND